MQAHTLRNIQPLASQADNAVCMLKAWTEDSTMRQIPQQLHQALHLVWHVLLDEINLRMSSF